MISTLVEIRTPSWVNCHRPVILNDFQTFQIPDGGLFHLAGVCPDGVLVAKAAQTEPGCCCPRETPLVVPGSRRMRGA